MLFCKRPYEHLYIGYRGVTRCCSWAGKRPLGSLSEKSLDEIWNGPDAQALRASIEDQSFAYCSKISCPLLSNKSLPNLSPDDFKKEVDSRDGISPTEFNIAYDFICNHVCPSCREENFAANEDYKALMQHLEEQILPSLKNAKIIMASGNGDPFASNYMMSLLSKIAPDDKRCLIKLETNGVLVKRNWSKIKHLESYRISIVVTPNSYERETYTYLSGGKDNLDETLESLDFLGNLRRRGGISEFKITMVVQPRNFREVPQFIETSLDRFNPDLIQLRPLMQWFKLSKEKHQQQNLLDPNHPNHQEFIEVMKNPLCSHPKVYHWIGNNYRE